MTSVVAGLISFVGVAGWFGDQWWLTNYGGDVTMKFVTASSLGLVVSARHSHRYFAVMLSTFVLFYALGSIFADAATWFVEEPEHIATLSVAPGVPSLATVGLIVSWCLSIEFEQLEKVVAWLSITLAATCLIGHWIEVDWMRFYAPWSTAMAIPTAIVFGCLGISELSRHKD